MNRTFKFGFVALALMAVTSAFAEECDEEESTIGFTPIAVGLATPVQLPWGINCWDVYGLDLNLFYSDTPTMYGLDIGGLATLTRGSTKAVVLSGLANIAFEDVYGVRGTLGLEYCAKTVYGADFGLVGLRDTIYGLDAEFLGSYQRRMCGLQVSGLANVSSEESYGASLAFLANLAQTAYGLQFAFIFNMTEELHGAQIALVNYTDACPSGFQVGLVNIIMQNQVKVLPFVNGYF